MKPEFILAHHPVIPHDGKPQFERINLIHKELGFPKSSLGFYCGYHFAIEENGDIIQARETDERGAHAVSYNPFYLNLNGRSIGICLAGDFTQDKPTQAQIEALYNLVVMLQWTYGIPFEKILNHNQTKATVCPGVDLVEMIQDYHTVNLKKRLHKAENALKFAKPRRKLLLYRLISRLKRIIYPSSSWRHPSQ